jgi:ribonuclease HI
MQPAINVYCDGSMTPSFGMGCGVYIENSPLEYNSIMYKPNEPKHTSPRAELLALYYALQYASNVQGHVHIYSDNEYAVKTFNVYYPKWLQEGFGKKAHLDIITPMYEYYISQNGRITITHVYGHIGIDGNEKADKLAKRAAQLTPDTIITERI